jgi:uncharacterized membrane protein YkvA (DUF1232 family)
MDFNREYAKSLKSAERMIADPEATYEQLDDALNKAQQIDSTALQNVLDDLFLMISLVRDWMSGSYRKIPKRAIVAILGAIIYFVMPVDSIPDFLPGIGYIDDALVIALVIKSIHMDLMEYKQWKNSEAAASAE